MPKMTPSEAMAEVLVQEGEDVLLIFHAQGGKRAESQQESHQEDGQPLVRRQVVIDMQDDLLHRPSSIRG